jgi:hypothetical protein
MRELVAQLHARGMMLLMVSVRTLFNVDGEPSSLQDYVFTVTPNDQLTPFDYHWRAETEQEAIAQLRNLLDATADRRECNRIKQEFQKRQAKGA